MAANLHEQIHIFAFKSADTYVNAINASIHNIMIIHFTFSVVHLALKYIEACPIIVLEVSNTTHLSFLKDISL